MKGTAARGRTTTEDHVQSHWLASDPKNRAENVMIVDLLRNDLGRLCTFGSVHATDLFAVERYPTLWQMTSTITGELRPEAGFQDIFRALFPCGSITGAPKIRAMQLISQLEQQPRSVYTGAIGFFSKEESIFNVAIRTLVLNGESGGMGVGSGIVIDSKPADEWRECLLKAEFLTQSPTHPTPNSFSLVETLLWQGEYPLIELHLDRLEDSADYFTFPFNRAQTRLALENFSAKELGTSTELGAPSFPRLLAERVGDHEPKSAHRQSHKVRLLLNPDGSSKSPPSRSMRHQPTPSASALPRNEPTPKTLCTSTKPPIAPSMRKRTRPQSKPATKKSSSSISETKSPKPPSTTSSSRKPAASTRHQSIAACSPASTAATSSNRTPTRMSPPSPSKTCATPTPSIYATPSAASAKP
jgi:hypothetical protein